MHRNLGKVLQYTERYLNKYPLLYKRLLTPNKIHTFLSNKTLVSLETVHPFASKCPNILFVDTWRNLSLFFLFLHQLRFAVTLTVSNFHFCESLFRWHGFMKISCWCMSQSKQLPVRIWIKCWLSWKKTDLFSYRKKQSHRDIKKILVFYWF